MMVYQAKLDQQVAMLKAQTNGAMQQYVHDLANSKPDPAMIACWAKARTDATSAYKTFAASTKSEKVMDAAKAVLAAWLNNQGTDGVSNDDSAEAVALRKAESDLEVEAMTQ